MSLYDDDNDVITDGPGLLQLPQLDRQRRRSRLDPRMDMNNAALDLNDYPLDYADPNSPANGMQELRMLILLFHQLSVMTWPCAMREQLTDFIMGRYRKLLIAIR